MNRKGLPSRTGRGRTRGNEGVAIITAMLVVTLVVSVVSFMLWRQDIWARKMENAALHTQAESVARAAIHWIGAIIVKERGRRLDRKGSRKITGFRVENGFLAGRVEDAQGKFNINNVVRGGNASGRDVAILKRLFDLRNVPPGLVDAVVDWIDADDKERAPGGAEDLFYLGLSVPYRAANRPLMDMNDLYWVKGFDGAVIDALRPYVTVLPVPMPVNINSMNAVTLASLSENISYQDARTILSAARSRRFSSVSQFRELLPGDGSAIKDGDLTVESVYYFAVSEAAFQHVRSRYQALLEVSSARTWAKVVWMKGT